MPIAPVVTMEGQPAGEITLSEKAFGQPWRRGLVTEGVLNELANRRVGTHKTKTRGEVSGGGKKPWRQKGTGRARQGSIRAPQWRHGGVVFGPVPRDYGYHWPKSQRRAALRSAWGQKFRDKSVVVVDRLEMATPKTKRFVEFLHKVQVESPALIVLHQKDENVIKSARNIPGIKLSSSDGVTLHDLLKYRTVVMTPEAVRQVERRLENT